MDTLHWLRVIGDSIFAVGVLALAWFVLGLKTGWSLTVEREKLMEDPTIPPPDRT